MNDPLDIYEITKHLDAIVAYLRKRGFGSILICEAGCCHFRAGEGMTEEQRSNGIDEAIAAMKANLSPRVQREIAIAMVTENGEEAWEMLSRWMKLVEVKELTGEDLSDGDPRAAKFGEILMAAGLTMGELQQLRKEHANRR